MATKRALGGRTSQGPLPAIRYRKSDWSRPTWYLVLMFAGQTADATAWFPAIRLGIRVLPLPPTDEDHLPWPRRTATVRPLLAPVKLTTAIEPSRAAAR